MINSIEVPSRSRANVTHTLYIHEGKAVGCSCEHRQFHPWMPCPHMIQHEQAQRDERVTRRIYFELVMGY